MDMLKMLKSLELKMLKSLELKKLKSLELKKLKSLELMKSFAHGEVFGHGVGFSIKFEMGER